MRLLPVHSCCLITSTSRNGSCLSASFSTVIRSLMTHYLGVLVPFLLMTSVGNRRCHPNISSRILLRVVMMQELVLRCAP